MTLNINKEVLLEEVSKIQNKDDIAYHYSNKKFPEIKTREMLGMELPEQATPDSNYNKTVSLVPAPLSPEIIKKYRQTGFKAWGNSGDPIYEYKISISKNKNAFVKNIKFTSVEEQTKYEKNNNWDRFFKDRGIDTKKILKDDDYWDKNQDKYFKIKKEYKSNMYNYLERVLPKVTPDNYKKLDWIKKIKDRWNWYLEYNLKHGSKSQYATYIPHIHTEIKAPLKIESVKKII